jgi:hypothetical protein
MAMLFDHLFPNMIKIQYIHMMMATRGILKSVHLHLNILCSPLEKSMLERVMQYFKDRTTEYFDG